MKTSSQQEKKKDKLRANTITAVRWQHLRKSQKLAIECL